MAKGEVILPGDLPAEITSVPAAAAEPVGAGRGGSAAAAARWTGRRWGGRCFDWARQEGKLKVLPAVERELIIQALLETKGNQVQAAKLLGITRATLRKRVEKFKIKQELAIQ